MHPSTMQARPTPACSGTSPQWAMAIQENVGVTPHGRYSPPRCEWHCARGPREKGLRRTKGPPGRKRSNGVQRRPVAVRLGRDVGPTWCPHWGSWPPPGPNSVCVLAAAWAKLSLQPGGPLLPLSPTWCSTTGILGRLLAASWAELCVGSLAASWAKLGVQVVGLGRPTWRPSCGPAEVRQLPSAASSIRSPFPL